jgi:hypothetical protein
MTTERDAPDRPVDAMKCLRCGGELQSMGVEKFRVGGTTGGIKLLIGEWGELGEKMLPLEILVCDTCRHVDLRLPASA